MNNNNVSIQTLAIVRRNSHNKFVYRRMILLKNQAVIADQCFVADQFFDRLRGMMGKKSFSPWDAILIEPCNSIHMLFMRISIDVVFLKKLTGTSKENHYVVTSVRENLKPWTLLPLFDWRARQTLELPVGVIERLKIQKGDEVCLS